MKKFFLMIVGMVSALCVQAQGKFTLTEGDTFKSTDQVTSVPGITLTFGGEGGADFKAAKADTHVDGYTAYTEGNGTNGESEGGTYYVFAPEETGLVSAAFALKGDAKLFVEEDGKVLTNFNGISCKTDYANVFDICVKAGKTYKVYSSESELGFYGFEYKVAQNLTTIANDYIKSHSSSLEYQIELEPGGVYYMSGPIVSDKGIIILGNAKNNPIVDASAVTSSIIKMNTTPAVAYVDGKRYEIDNVVLKNINFKGVYQYIYDDQKIVYGVNNFIIEGCQFELTNTKQDIDCPFRFQAGGPVKFSMKDNTMYQTGTFNYKYFVKLDNNWPDKRFATFTGPYVWEIENNTIVGVANQGQFMNGGRTANIYSKTSISIRNNIFIDCVKPGSDNFWNKVFGGKNSDSDRKKFVLLSTISNTYITNGEDVSSCTVKYDKGTKLTSKPLFAFPAKGDFTIGEGCQQYESLAGASKWLKNYAGGMIDIVPESGSDLTKLLYESYAENNNPGAIQITLAKDGKYIVSGSLYIGCPLTILGAEGAEIDASANKNPFILMRPMPEVGLNDFGAYEISKVEIKDVKITGLKNRLFYADRQNYLIDKLAVENSIIQLDGSTPRSIFDFYCGGNFKELSILNSTLSADPSNAMRGGLLSTQSSKSIIEMGGTEQKISIKNSTLYNIAKGMTPVLLQRHSQAYLTFEVKNSVIVNSGEAGKFALGLNEGQESNQPKWLVETNTFTFDGEDSGAKETIAKGTVPGPVSFVDAANNDFTLNILSDVFDAGIGDPRWLVPAEGSIVVEPASGDLGAAVAAATEGKTVKTLLVKLAKDGQYTTTKPIVTGGALVLRGNGATIDASELNDNMIAMAAVENPTVWTEGNIIITDLTVKGLKKALFYSTNKKYVAKDFIINNSVIEQAGDATTIDYTKGGTALNLVLSNSTFYAPTATTKSFYSSQGGEKATEYASDAVQTFNILHSTFVNLAPGKNFFSHRQNSQKWLAFNIEDNIFVDCGKSGQTIKGINGGGSSANPVWNVKNNAFNFGGEDTGAAESTGDDKEPMQGYVAGVVTFKNAAAGNFTLGYTSPQHDANIGDPRWVITPENVTVNIASGDINAALDEALAKVKAVKDIHINLTDGGKYTISKTIVVPNGLHIVTGDIMALGHQNATIDASGLEGPMITTPAEAPDEWVKANILIDDVTIKGLKKPLFASAAKNYYYEQFSIWGSVIELAADVTTLDFTKGSVANLMISSSTIYAPTATTKAFYSSQSGQKATEYAEDAEQQFIIFASTLYNLAPGKNFFTHRQANQKWLTYNLQNNIFVNCGKSGQVVKGVNGGQSGKNPKWMIVNNLFNYDGKDTSAEESTGDADEPVEKSIPGVVTFADANGGDFNATITLAEGAEKPALAGDVYHWKVNYAEATAIEGVKTAEDENIDLENAVIYNLNGQRVDKAQAKRGIFIVNGKKVVIK